MSYKKIHIVFIITILLVVGSCSNNVMPSKKTKIISNSLNNSEFYDCSKEACGYTLYCICNEIYDSPHYGNCSLIMQEEYDNKTSPSKKMFITENTPQILSNLNLSETHCDETPEVVSYHLSPSGNEFVTLGTCHEKYQKTELSVVYGDDYDIYVCNYWRGE